MPSKLMPDDAESSLQEQLGEYRLIERIGSGGMGTVYKALHKRLDRIVAIKVLPHWRADDSRAVERFEREMKAIGRLDHPHVVRAYDARKIDGRLILIMEYVEGLDLAKIGRRLGRLDVADACELARQAALGLQVAYEHGLVHRDVKPSNLMLTPDGRVKLLDLGLARFHGGLSPLAADNEMTDTGQAMGTADYMAPEQTSDSRTADIRADVYGLGATLYKLLAGRAPFDGPEYHGPLDKMLAHRRDPVPPCPNIPDGLAAVLDRMLAKSPEDRYSTPAEAAEALAPWCADCDLPTLLEHAIEARESSYLPRREDRDEGRRSPLPLAVSHGWRFITTILILLLLVGGLGFAAGIMIRIKKDGRETAIEVPEGSTTRIGPDGGVNVELPGSVKSSVNPAAELNVLRGLWKVVRVEKGKYADSAWQRMIGNDYGIENPATARRLVFGEGTLDVLSFEKAIAWQFDYSIDPAATPQIIDLRQETGGEQRGPLRAVGIYEIDGDRMKICLRRYLPTLRTPQRPERFAAEPDSRDILFVLERHRPSMDERLLQGNQVWGSLWAVVSQIEDGKPLSEETLHGRHCRFARWQFDISDIDTEGVSRARTFGLFILDAAKQPKEITIYAQEVDKRWGRQDLLGIYKLDGDRLTIAYRQNGPRPEKFESKPGSGVTLLVLRRKTEPAKTERLDSRRGIDMTVE